MTMVASRIGLQEKDYFGLAFIDDTYVDYNVSDWFK